MNKKGYIRNIEQDKLNNKIFIVFQGCNFNCTYCDKKETVKVYNSLYGHDEVKLLSSFDILEIVKESLITDIVITGGECTLQYEFLLELVKLLKKNECKITIETNGFLKVDDFQKLTAYIDNFIFDFKIFNEKEHFKFTGEFNRKIKRNMKIAGFNKKILEVRTDYLKGINNEKNISEISEFLSRIDKNIELKVLKNKKKA